MPSGSSIVNKTQPVNISFLQEGLLSFPPTKLALDEPNGLLAVGGDLSSARLIEAYRRGIFPWYEQGQPILWWSPSPRTVLYPEGVHCSSSMRKWLRKSSWQAIIDRDFAQVVEQCAAPRPGSGGTWITSAMKEAYIELHRVGVAHSIEIYDDTERLVGGLYGIAYGSVFYGESMFSRAANASKMALIILARYLHLRGFALIDCQVASEHLFSLGAQQVAREDFEAILAANATISAHQRQQAAWLCARNTAISYDGHLLD